MSLNNKFAKYGVVLIAAITVATAVQAQNITTQYAYAEEVTANDPALNRMLYLDYSAPEDSTVGWLTGNVVTPAGYTVRPADEVEGFPYYTITGSDGKSYSAGDTITVEDPLVNHANPEDNVLYYRYYSVDPNASTSEAPAPSTSPSTSEAPAVEKPSQKADDKTTATDKAKNAKADKKADSKKAKDQVKTEKSKDATVAAKDDSTSKKAEASAPAEQAKAVKANTNANSQDNIVKEADGTVDTAAVHNDNTGFLLTVLGFVSAAFIGLRKTKKEEK